VRVRIAKLKQLLGDESGPNVAERFGPTTITNPEFAACHLQSGAPRMLTKEIVRRITSLGCVFATAAYEDARLRQLEVQVANNTTKQYFVSRI